MKKEDSWAEVLLAVVLALASCAIIFLAIVGVVNYFS